MFGGKHKRYKPNLVKHGAFRPMLYISSKNIKMNHVKIPYYDGEFYYEINPRSGNLIQHANKFRDSLLPQKVKDALNLCENPYLVNPHNANITGRTEDSNKITKLNRMHKNFMAIGNKRFYISLLYSKLRKNLFDNTELAFSTISKNIPEQIERRHELCLQRSLLALKTSNSFKQSGVLFIGAALPTGNMHAWIIESNCNPDHQDREWIMYRPLLAFYY